MANKLKIVRNTVSAEDFTAKYIELYQAGLDANGNTSATLQDVADALGLSVANAYQKVRNLNKELTEAGTGYQLPKLRTNPVGRQARLDITKIAAMLAATKAREALDQLD
jgi:hypothetical protein